MRKNGEIMSCPVFFECTEKKGTLSLITGSETELLNCMGNKFEVLDPSKAEGAGEKHLPEVKIDGRLVTVQVGSVSHPMTEEHSIEWIYLETKEGCQLKKLNANQAPSAQFSLSPNDEPVAAYAYCNMHGFWKTEF